MRIAYLDCASTGVSGDKFLAALLDAGLDQEELQALLRRLPLTGWRLNSFDVTRAGVRCLQVRIQAEEPQPVRTWRDIREMIEESGLPAEVRDASVRTFSALADAEASVHGTPSEEVHFHEVGAVDSILDIVGACAGLHLLGIDRLTVSPIAVGFGSVDAAHGTLPVPAPATAILLEDMQVTSGDAEGELTTPTGAAIVKALAGEIGPLPDMLLQTVGTGAGGRDLDVPNVARLFVGNAVEDDGERAVLLETNLDHVTPEHAAYASERLLEAGALDVWSTPAAMKKGRPAWVLSALASSEDAARLAELLATETGTLGVRLEQSKRWIEPREVRRVSTSLGEVRVKVGGRPLRARPEHDDVAALAREHSLPYDEMSRRLTREVRDALGLPE